MTLPALKGYIISKFILLLLKPLYTSDSLANNFPTLPIISESSISTTVSPKSIRVGVVGLSSIGWAARALAPGLINAPSFPLAAVSATSAVSAEAFAKKYSELAGHLLKAFHGDASGIADDENIGLVAVSVKAPAQGDERDSRSGQIQSTTPVSVSDDDNKPTGKTASPEAPDKIAFTGLFKSGAISSAIFRADLPASNGRQQFLWEIDGGDGSIRLKSDEIASFFINTPSTTLSTPSLSLDVAWPSKITDPKEGRKLWAHNTPYFPLAAYQPVPRNCELTQAIILQRHGAREAKPKELANIKDAILRLQNATAYYDPRLAFLQDYTWDLGDDTELLPFGALE
ncbi:hypothetical protein HWV62_36881 [Athelia sp. TMB]|nr:hypothetical protein HWV62_36881 [Athelia sp. TMB]